VHGTRTGTGYVAAPMSLLVVLELEAKPGKGDEMIAVLRETLKDTRARKGCEGVTVHRDTANPDAIVLVERWATREDDTAYREWRAGDGATPEMAPLVAGRPRIVWYEDVDA
jgi:quinol monooxygenase YgiN